MSARCFHFCTSWFHFDNAALTELFYHLLYALFQLGVIC